MVAPCQVGVASDLPRKVGEGSSFFDALTAPRDKTACGSHVCEVGHQWTRGVQPVASKLVSRENVHAILGGVIMIVCLPLTIVTFFLALILIGQPNGNMAITTADVFASIFSVAFFAAFAPSR
jgi:hypothetical protein